MLAMKVQERQYRIKENEDNTEDKVIELENNDRWICRYEKKIKKDREGNGDRMMEKRRKKSDWKEVKDVNMGKEGRECVWKIFSVIVFYIFYIICSYCIVRYSNRTLLLSSSNLLLSSSLKFFDPCYAYIIWNSGWILMFRMSL